MGGSGEQSGPSLLAGSKALPLLSALMLFLYYNSHPIYQGVGEDWDRCPPAIRYPPSILVGLSLTLLATYVLPWVYAYGKARSVAGDVEDPKYFGLFALWLSIPSLLLLLAAPYASGFSAAAAALISGLIVAVQQFVNPLLFLALAVKRGLELEVRPRDYALFWLSVVLAGYLFPSLVGYAIDAAVVSVAPQLSTLYLGPLSPRLSECVAAAASAGPRGPAQYLEVPTWGMLVSGAVLTPLILGFLTLKVPASLREMSEGAKP